MNAPAAGGGAPASPVTNPTASNFQQGLAQHRASPAGAPPAAPQAAPGGIDPNTGMPAGEHMPADVSAAEMQRRADARARATGQTPRADDGTGELMQMRSAFDQATPPPNDPAQQQQPPADPNAPPAAPELFHGMTDAQLLEAIKTGYVPEGLYDKLKIKGQRGEEVFDIPLHELRDGGMRQSDYNRAHSKLRDDKVAHQAEVQRTQEREQAWNDMITAMQDPRNVEQTREILEDMGIPLFDLGKIVSSEWWEVQEMRKVNPQLADRMEATRKQAADARRQLRDMQRKGALGQRDTQRSEEGSLMGQSRATLQTHMEPALKAQGLPDNPEVRREVGQQIDMLIGDGKGKLLGPITPQVLRQAVQAAREVITDRARQQGGGQRPQVQQAAPAQQQPPAQQPGGGVRIQDMHSHMQQRFGR